MTAHEIVHSLMARPRRNRDGWLVPCVCHDDRHPSLSIRDGEDGKILVHCFRGCNQREILKTLREMGLLDGSSPAPPPPPSRPINRAQILNNIIEATHPIEPESIVARYMAGRAISLQEWPGDLREHLDLMVYEDGKATGKKYPAMVAIIKDGKGEPVGLHLTFLEKDGSGKAPVENPRRIIGVKEGSTRRATVRLFEPRDGTIGLAEGLETAIAAYLLTGIPTWAALNAGGIERAELPEEIKRVVVFADNDRSMTGQRAAAKAALRFRSKGRETRILVPDEPGKDFNDILQIKNARRLAG